MTRQEQDAIAHILKVEREQLIHSGDTGRPVGAVTDVANSMATYMKRKDPWFSRVKFFNIYYGSIT